MIRVAIVEDQREIREALSLLIGGTKGYFLAENLSEINDAIIAYWLIVCPRLFFNTGVPSSIAFQKPLLTEKDPPLIIGVAAACPMVPVNAKLPPELAPPPPAMTDGAIGPRA